MQGMREGQGLGREWGRGREEKEKRERQRRKRKVQRGRMEPGAGRLVRATDGDRGSGKVCVEEGKLALKRKDGRRASVAIDEKGKKIATVVLNKSCT